MDLGELEVGATPVATELNLLEQGSHSSITASKTTLQLSKDVGIEASAAKPGAALLSMNSSENVGTDTSTEEEELPPPLPSARVQVSKANWRSASTHIIAESPTPLQTPSTPMIELDQKQSEMRDALTPAAAMAVTDALSLDLVAGSVEAVTAEQAGTRALANLRYMEIGRAYAQAVLPKFGGAEHVLRATPRTPPRKRMVFDKASTKKGVAAGNGSKREPTTPPRSTMGGPGSQLPRAVSALQRLHPATAPPRSAALSSDWVERLSQTPDRQKKQPARTRKPSSPKNQRSGWLHHGAHPTTPTPSQRRFRDAAKRASSPVAMSPRLRAINAQLVAQKQAPRPRSTFAG